MTEEHSGMNEIKVYASPTCQDRHYYLTGCGERGEESVSLWIKMFISGNPTVAFKRSKIGIVEIQAMAPANAEVFMGCLIESGRTLEDIWGALRNIKE